MSNLDRTLIAFLLDRSGSMHTIKSDVEGGYAAFVDEQRHAPGECVATLVQFSSDYQLIYSDVPIAEVPPLQLRPRGNTALLDAMGRFITETRAHIDSLPDAERPGTVIVAIMTDGKENASREWTRDAIKLLVQEMTAAHDWQFLYMGADQDAIEVGTRMGLKREQSVTYSKGKARDAMAALSGNLSSYRYAKSMNPQAAMPEFSDAQRADLADDGDNLFN